MFRSISRSVVSDSLRPHESQHARPPCTSPTPGVHSDSCPSSQWCHPAISSSVVPFSSCFQSLPASKSFPMSQLFTWGGQSTGVSALASFLPKNTCWRGCKEKGTLLPCWWECKPVQPPWRTVWRFLKKLQIELPHDLAIPLLGKYPEKNIIRKDTCIPIFTAALFTIAETWKQPKCPPTEE